MQRSRILFDVKNHSSPLDPWKGLPRRPLKTPEGASLKPGEKVVSELLVGEKGDFLRRNFQFVEGQMEAAVPLKEYTLLARWECRIPDPKATLQASKKEQLQEVFEFFCGLYEGLNENVMDAEILTEEQHSVYKDREGLLYWTALWLERSRVLKEIEPLRNMECYYHAASGQKFVIKKTEGFPNENFLNALGI